MAKRSRGRPDPTGRLLDQARGALLARDRDRALALTVEALRSDATNPAAWFQCGLLVDDHLVPTHDELAYRCVRRAVRLAPDEPAYRRELARRSVCRWAVVQGLRQVANLPLLLGGLVEGLGSRVAGKLLVPLAWLLALPGVLAHQVINLVVVWPMSTVLEARFTEAALRGDPDPDLDDRISTLQ